MTVDPAILDRVRKLLALAGSPNAHEAAAAAARAQALITRWRLEEVIAAEAAAATDPDPITDGRDAPLEVGRRLRKWKVALAGALADANGAMAWVWDRGRDEAICVVARGRDRELVRAMWDALLKRVEWASATAGPGRDRAWHEAYRIGVADAIADRLAAGDDDVRDGIDGTTLARVDARAAADAAALERFVAERFGVARGRALRVDARGYARGRRDGAAMPLPPKR